MSLRVLVALTVFRLLSVAIVRSWFVPDEVYQSSEVAHSVVFGTGHLSWEWDRALRSVIHPALIALFYKLLSFLNLTSQFEIALIPRIVHALIFAFGDLSYYNLCKRLLPTSVCVRYSMFTYLSCWFVYYCASRTLSNSLETALTLIALQWYPFEGKRSLSSVWPYMSIGFLTIVIRPTAALIWLVLGLAHVYNSPHPFRLVFFTALPAVFPVAISAFVMDSMFYRRPTFSMWNFLSFNVLEGGSAHFGVHPWHWYISQGLPSVMTIQLIPVLLGLSTRQRPSFLLLVASLFYIIFHSVLPHKEQRFLLPIIPLLCIYAGPFFGDRPHSKIKSYLFYLMITVNVIVSLYTGLRHQVGPYSAIDYVINRNGTNKNVLALMPCYSLPGSSYFHDRIASLRQLDCSPDLLNLGISDEAETFYSDPAHWISSNPLDDFSYVLMYEKMYANIFAIMKPLNFSVCARIFHSDFLTSSRQDNYILVLCKS